MDSSSQESYRSVFTHLKEVVPNFEMENVILSFANNLHAPLKELLPQVMLYCSLFHYQEVINLIFFFEICVEIILCIFIVNFQH